MERAGNGRSLHDRLLAAVERAAELHDTSSALHVEHEGLTRELRESLARLRRKREAVRARWETDPGAFGNGQRDARGRSRAG